MTRRRPSALLSLILLLVAGCGRVRWPSMLSVEPPAFEEAAYAKKRFTAYRVEPGSDVVGEIRHHRVRKGESLFEIARWYDLGYNEVVDANPGVDPLVPPVGTNVVLPTEWVLPCCTTEGIVVNIPEMRLYQYRRDAEGLTVETYPVGLGRQGWRTPRGRFAVRTKTVNPRWVVPESIRKEHIRDSGDDRRSIAGGAADNPLGKYRLALTIRPFSIHGTDIPWGIGMQVTHGCIRLYPEDIERLFGRVDVGTPVELTYQPVKAGRRADDVWVEVHKDIYGYAKSPYRAALDALGQRRLRGAVDPAALEAAVRTPGGVPFRLPAATRAS